MPQHSDPRETLAYYNEHGDDFALATVDVSMGEHHARFLPHVPQGGKILDLGCGSGRDTLAFIRAGYDVTALDGSETMVAATQHLTGLIPLHKRFQDVHDIEAFDGIWACASLLHVPRAELNQVVSQILAALKPGGVLYLSFKSGQGERVSKGRHFTDFTVGDLEAWLRGFPTVQSVDVWESSDVRPDRAEEVWANAVVQKSGARTV